MRTITFSNNKGGSGKTTTVVSLAGVFAEMGLRVVASGETTPNDTGLAIVRASPASRTTGTS